jgi:hypothetical protein
MHKYKPIQNNDLSRVLQFAHMRRSADFGLWLRQYLENRRQAKRHEEAKPYLLSAIISLVAPVTPASELKSSVKSSGARAILRAGCRMHVNHFT